MKYRDLFGEPPESPDFDEIMPEADMRQLNAIGDLQQYRDRGEDRLGPGGYASLANALSGLTASMGTYGGRTPSNKALQRSSEMFRRSRKDRENQLIENIKLAGLEQEEERKQKYRITPINQATKEILASKLEEIGVPKDKLVEPGANWTYGDIEDDPLLGPLFQRTMEGPKSEDIGDLLAVEKYEQRQKARSQTLSDVERKILEKKFKEFGLSDYQIPQGFTRGDLEDLKNRPIIGEALEESFDREKLRSQRQREEEERKRRERERRQEIARERRERQEEIARERRERRQEIERERRERERKRKQEQKDKVNQEKLREKRKRKDEIRKMEVNLTKSKRVSNNLKKSIEELIGLIENYGTSELSNFKVDADMQGLAGDIRLELKELKNLGVLAGPDLDILREQIPDVGGASGVITNDDRALARLNRALQQIETKMKTHEQSIKDFREMSDLDKPESKESKESKETTDYPPVMFFKEDDGSITKMRINSQEDYEKAKEEGGTIDYESLTE